MADSFAAALIDWLTAESLRGQPPVALLEGLCERMVEGGVNAPSVNVAGRVAAQSRTLDRKVITLVSLGRYALRGIASPRELFTPHPTAGA
jgi:hypothetical protein